MIDESGLDHLSSHCPHLEQLSLSLSSLTALSFGTPSLYFNQISSLLHLTNLTRLFLPVMSRFLQHTPDFSLAQLPSLESLSFGLRLAQFSDFFPPHSQYSSLKRLQLNRCYIGERLPNSFEEMLPRLQELSISNWRSFSGLTDQFTSLACLESLTISSCDVEELDQFSTLPENFGDLPALKSLVLHKLPLCHLPASFTRLASLETFLLVGCEEMEELPAGFGFLSALRTLSLVCSPTLKLPEDLGGLTNLQTFHLKQYRKEQLPSSFSQLASLTRLELDQCSVGGLLEGVGEMAKLQELFIQDCRDITEIPESVSGLVSLRVLVIVRCASLTSVPRRLDSLTRLTQLEVRGCEVLKEAPQALPLSLQALSFVNNEEVVSLPSIPRLAELRTLHLGIVGARCLLGIGYHLSALEHLELALGEDAYEFLFALTRLSRLRTLTLKEVRSLNRLVKCGGSALQELRQLNIHTTCDELTELPAAITTLHHLTSLRILSPKLSSLPDSLGAFSRLRRLDLSKCLSLMHLPGSLTQLSCLHELNLSCTSIRLLPADFTQLSRLKKLELYDCKQLEALPDDISQLAMLDLFSTVFSRT
ncbi:unnamed protein product [Closterium sp. NIES-65]|nr:unnamed protein product [Closterium sp. NIES-65]